jgi:hypothetical protein
VKILEITRPLYKAVKAPDFLTFQLAPLGTDKYFKFCFDVSRELAETLVFGFHCRRRFYCDCRGFYCDCRGFYCDCRRFFTSPPHRNASDRLPLKLNSWGVF